MRGALDGVRVLDLSRVFAGPWAAQMLADLGADVVKVEHPQGGDDVRHMGFKDDGEGGTGLTSSFLAMNRNKRGVALDMREPGDLRTLRALADRADVVIENFKVGGLAKYGLDYASLSASNSRLIYCSITGYGQDGPYAEQPGYDPIFQAMSGLMSITGVPDGASGAGPVLVGYSVSDLNAGFYASIAILSALLARHETGHGQHIDLALLDAQVAAHSHIVVNHLVSGRMPVRAGAASQINTPWQSFPAADQPVMVAVGNDRQFLAFCSVLGLDGVPADPRFATNTARMANKPALFPLIEGALASRTARDWVAAFIAAGVPAGPLNDMGQMIADPQVVHRRMVRDRRDGQQPFVANPIRLSDTPVRYDRPSPQLGEHDLEVIEDWLGQGPSS